MSKFFLTHWVRSGSCHRETSLGYDNFLLSLDYKPTRTSDFFMMRQHLNAPISGAAQPYHSQYNPWVTIMTQQHCHQHDSASTSFCDQVAPALSSPAWLGSIVANMTRHLHHVVAKLLRQRHHQHDSATLSPAWLSSIVTSMTRHLHHAAAKLPWQCHR
jgi:hypothetical protein